jgi:ATP-binding cassette, subfamily B (MDR/TAP), member 1
LKDQTNKKAHEESTQIACEAAGAIRTVASLTREDDCSKIYSQSLEEPFRRSNQSAIWSNILFAISQSVTYVLDLVSFFPRWYSEPLQAFVIALVFWYGARLVSFLEFNNFNFFVSLIVRA